MTTNTESSMADGHIPVALTESMSMTEVNEKIDVYKGVFELRDGVNTIVVDGEMKFQWFPALGVVVMGTVGSSIGNVAIFLSGKNKFDLYIANEKFGECIITERQIGREVILKGVLNNTIVKGDKSIPIVKVKFVVPNLRGFNGISVQNGSYQGNDRLVFENDDYIITIDKRREYRKYAGMLKSVGGYITLYNGEVVKKHGHIVFDELRNLFYGLSTFLSFLNGRRCSPLFRQGTFNDQVIWIDYSNYKVDQYKGVLSWPPMNSMVGLSDMWNNFTELWKKKEDQDFLVTAVHWYVEANLNSGMTEGAIVMAQTSLELIYNWLMIERKKLLVGPDSLNISASNKIRLLLSDLKVSCDFPEQYSKLKGLQSSEIPDAPEAFVQIRNAIIHSQEQKRKKLIEMENEAKLEALHLGIWYIELALMRILGYHGSYQNRTARGAEEPVPWE